MPWQRPLYWLAAAFVILTSLRAGETLRTFGLSGRNLLRSSFVPLLALALSAVAVLVARHYGTLHTPTSARGFVHRFWGYAIFAFVQQFLLQCFFLLRLRRLLPGRTALAVVLAATIFAAAHIPNPVLTLLTIVWGLAASALFVRYRNLIPLWIAHAIFGITIAVCVPGSVTHNMRVGLGYLTYRPHAQRSAIDHTVSTRV